MEQEEAAIAEVRLQRDRRVLFVHLVAVEVLGQLLLGDVLHAEVLPDVGHCRRVAAPERVQHHDERVGAGRLAERLLVLALGLEVLFLGGREDEAGVAHDHQVPVVLLADRDDQHALLEYVDFLRPAFDLLVRTLQKRLVIMLFKLLMFLSVLGFPERFNNFKLILNQRFKVLQFKTRVKMAREYMDLLLGFILKLLIEPSEVKVDDVVVQVLLLAQRLVVVIGDCLSVVGAQPVRRKESLVT